jgi:hypothetical protein
VNVDEIARKRSTAPRRLQRALADDLDSIICALRKAPAERYASVLGLAEDVRRRRDGRPPKNSWRNRRSRFARA